MRWRNSSSESSSSWYASMSRAIAPRIRPTVLTTLSRLTVMGCSVRNAASRRSISWCTSVDSPASGSPRPRPTRPMHPAAPGGSYSGALGISVVVRSQAAVVEELPPRCPSRRPIVRVAARSTGRQSLQQGRDLGVARREADDSRPVAPGPSAYWVAVTSAGTAISIHSSRGRSRSAPGWTGTPPRWRSRRVIRTCSRGVVAVF